MSKGPSDEELVKARVDEFWAGLVANDIERVMACVSENFISPAFFLSNKAALKELLKKNLKPGAIQKDQIDESKVITTIRNDTATVAPFWVTSGGLAVVGLTLKKEEAVAKPAADRKEKAGKNPKLDWFITDMVAVGGN